MIFSDVNVAWKGETAVQQILVFASMRDKINFDIYYAGELERLHKDLTDHPDSKLAAAKMWPKEVGQGALYILRAALQSNDTWCAILRSGTTSELLNEFGTKSYVSDSRAQILVSANEALRKAHYLLLDSIKNDLRNNADLF